MGRYLKEHRQMIHLSEVQSRFQPQRTRSTNVKKQTGAYPRHFALLISNALHETRQTVGLQYIEFSSLNELTTVGVETAHIRQALLSA
jgi:hypothetical protein